MDGKKTTDSKNSSEVVAGKRGEEDNKKKNKRPMPPPLDFHALIKLAEKKQHEPIVLPTVKKEPERLLSAKEKRQMEEINKAREMRERQRKEALDKPKNIPATKAVSNGATPFKIPVRPSNNGAIQKASTLARTATTATTAKTTAHSNLADKSNTSFSNKKSPATVSNPSKIGNSTTSMSSLNSKITANGQRPNIPQKTNNTTSIGIKPKPAIVERTREFPPRDIREYANSYGNAQRIQSQTKRKYK